MTVPRAAYATLAVFLLVGCGVSTQDSPVRLGPSTPPPGCVPEVSELTSAPPTLPIEEPATQPPVVTEEQSDVCS